MKRILAIVGRDITSGKRDFIYAYIMIIPFIMALVLKAIIPGVDTTTVNIAVLDTLEPQLIEYLDEFAKVKEFETIQDIRVRVSKTDDYLGLVKKDDKYNIISQNNESEGSYDFLELIVNSYQKDLYIFPIDIKITDSGWKLHPLKQQGANFLIIFTTVFGGMLILLSLVEEKMSNTLSAINVSPTSKFEFIIGKSILGLTIPIVGIIGILLIVGFEDINYLMVIVVSISVSFISMIIGFVIGIMNDEPISAIASMKMIFIPVMGSVFGAMYLSEKFIPLLYWSPFYWAYEAMNSIILNEATWPMIFKDCLIITFITALVFMLLRNRIKRGLN